MCPFIFVTLPLNLQEQERLSLLEEKQKLHLERNAFQREKDQAQRLQQDIILNKKGNVRPKVSFGLKTRT